MYIKHNDDPLTVSECIQLIATAVVYDIFKQDKDHPDHILLPNKETGKPEPKFIVDAAVNFAEHPTAQQTLIKKLKQKRVIPKFVDKIKVGKEWY